MDQEEKRKKNFRRAFVIMTVVLLGLTFLSKSLYHYRLPVVTAKLPGQGRLAEDGELYDTLVPAAALCKDATGWYVLVLRENDSVLGEDYKAYRMSVDLLGTDGTYCAVRGLPADEYVIITSTGEIADGSCVFYEGDDT